jgi:hypothetical protein
VRRALRKLGADIHDARRRRKLPADFVRLADGTRRVAGAAGAGYRPAGAAATDSHGYGDTRMSDLTGKTALITGKDFT